jgi:phosphopantetheine adenylyltransferase
MSYVNKNLYPDYELLLMQASDEYSKISSGMVKAVHKLGADISFLVDPIVEKRIKNI